MQFIAYFFKLITNCRKGRKKINMKWVNYLYIGEKIETIKKNISNKRKGWTVKIKLKACI